MIIALLALCVVLDVVRELCFKLGARASTATHERGGFALSKPAIGWPVAGAIVWGIEILCWAGVLANLPLNIAFPVMSLTYAATPLAGAVLLNEKIGRKQWIGIALVTLGVMLVGSEGIG